MVKEIVFDFETTGLDYSKDKIVQYTFLNNETGEYISSYVNPERPMEIEASKVTGITDLDLKEYKPFSHHVKKIVDFVGKEKDTYLIAHNGDAFDKLFLLRELQLCRKTIPSSWKFIDTLKLSRRFFPEFKKHTMDVLRDYLQLSTKNNHNAAKDVFDLSIIYNSFRQNHSAKDLYNISFYSISFGKYRGQDYREIPSSYMDFLVEKKVYLNHPDLFTYLYDSKIIS